MLSTVFQVIVFSCMVGQLFAQYDDLGDYAGLDDSDSFNASPKNENSKRIAELQAKYPYTNDDHGPVGHAPEYDWTMLKDVMQKTGLNVLKETKKLIANIDHEFEMMMGKRKK